MEKSERLLFSPYAPVRFQNEFWWKFAVDKVRQGAVTADGRIASTLPDDILHQLVNPAIHAAALELKAQRFDQSELGHLVGQMAGKMMEQRHWNPLVAQFISCGRQIFDLTDEVVELLANTDFDDCTLGEWNPPYESFFVRFGKREDIRIPWGADYEYLDGAFVAVTPWDDAATTRRIKFGFTTIKSDGRGVMTPGYFLDLLPDEQSLPILEGIEMAIARRIKSFEGSPDDSPSVKALNAHRRSEVQDGGEILRAAAALLVNSLFYLESIGESRSLEPGRDAPTDLVVKWASANPKQRDKLKSRLLSDGYAPVYLLGKEISSPSHSVSETGSKRAHWRRGHWRMQRHGKGRAMVKRIWMKPIMIGSDKVHDDMPGRIYVVGSNNSPNSVQ